VSTSRSSSEGREQPMSTATKNTRGLLGTKLGMTQTWDENNRVVPVTVIQAGPCVVTEVRTSASHGYDGVQIAFGDIDPRKVTSPMRGHFDKAGVAPSRTGRRAPVAPVRARPARRSSPVVAWCTARRRATTASGPRRR
jgi:hypothetical protein